MINPCLIAAAEIAELEKSGKLRNGEWVKQGDDSKPSQQCVNDIKTEAKPEQQDDQLKENTQHHHQQQDYVNLQM